MDILVVVVVAAVIVITEKHLPEDLADRKFYNEKNFLSSN